MAFRTDARPSASTSNVYSSGRMRRRVLEKGRSQMLAFDTDDRVTEQLKFSVRGSQVECYSECTLAPKHVLLFSSVCVPKLWT